MLKDGSWSSVGKREFSDEDGSYERSCSNAYDCQGTWTSFKTIESKTDLKGATITFLVKSVRADKSGSKNWEKSHESHSHDPSETKATTVSDTGEIYGYFAETRKWVKMAIETAD